MSQFNPGGFGWVESNRGKGVLEQTRESGPVGLMYRVLFDIVGIILACASALWALNTKSSIAERVIGWTVAAVLVMLMIAWEVSAWQWRRRSPKSEL